MVFYYSCFNPTIDRWFNEQVRDRYSPEDCSPIHNIRLGIPPSLVIHGTKDRNCPFRHAKAFSEKMLQAGNRCELRALEGAGHIFVFDEKYRKEAAKTMKDFLTSLGYIPIPS